MGCDPLDEFTSRLFELTANGWLFWWRTARELVCAANMLHGRWLKWRPQRLRWWMSRRRIIQELDRTEISFDTIAMLYGLAIENLVKALMIAKGIPATRSGHLNAKLRHHDLVRLFHDADVPVTRQQIALLKRLRWSIESGKYPVATTRDFDSTRPEDVEHIGGLLNGLEDELRNCIRGGYPKANLLQECTE